MKLLIQPDDGVEPLVNVINKAKETLDIAIFRFDRKELERAIVNAANRGVEVRALVACSNRGGEKRLRDLETRFLGAGIVVARTGDDLVRYHAKYLIVDARELIVLGFNFTYLDIQQSRSFGVITTDKSIVQEAMKLFDADVKRQNYTSGSDSLIVSPANARQKLAAFIAKAKKELCIYDPNVSDPAMVRALEERRRNGVDIKVIGKTSGSKTDIAVMKLHETRLHTRMILRDSEEVFIGSQSLRALELDRRREVGLLFTDAGIAQKVAETFRADWTAAEQAKLNKQGTDAPPATKVAKRIAKAVVRELPPMATMVDGAIQELGADGVEVAMTSEDLQESVKDAVKHAVKTAIKDAVVA